MIALSERASLKIPLLALFSGSDSINHEGKKVNNKTVIPGSRFSSTRVDNGDGSL